MTNEEFWGFIETQAIPSLRRYVRYCNRFRYMSPDDVNDIVQETLLRLVRHTGDQTPFHVFSSAEGKLFVLPWLRKVAYRVMVDLGRKPPIDQLDDEHNPEAPPQEPAYLTRYLMRKAYLTLTEEEQEVLYLEYEGYTQEEVSLLLGMNRKTVYRRIKSAKNKLGGSEDAQNAWAILEAALKKVPWMKFIK